MNNIRLFQRETEGKLDWSYRDWINFTNALYKDITQSNDLLSIKNRLEYELRKPTSREIVTILDIIKAKYISNNINTNHIDKLLRNNFNEIINIDILVSDIINKTLSDEESEIPVPNILTSRSVANVPFTDVSNDWQGRMTFATLADGTHFAIWKEGTNHSDYNSATEKTNCCFFNADFSIRSDNNKDLEGNSIAGFPLTPPTASTGFVDYNIISCPNGQFVLWAQNRGVNASAWNGVNFTIHQYRGSADCKTWVYEFDVPSKFGYTTTAQKAMIQAFYESCIVGNRIFIPVCEIPSVITNTRVRLIISDDNGTNYSVLSNITTLGEGVGSTNETAIGYNGGSGLTVVIRTEATTYNVSYKRESNDLGVTWGDLIDITPALGYVAVHQPSLRKIGSNWVLTGRRMESFALGPFERNGCWTTPIVNSFEVGNTTDILLDPYNAGNGATDINNGDSGYTRVIMNPDKTTFTLFGYYGTADTANFYKYVIGHTDIPSTEKTSNNEYRFAITTGFRLPLSRDNFFAVGTPNYSSPVLPTGLAIIGRAYNRFSTGNHYWEFSGTNRPEFTIINNKGWAIFNGSTRGVSITSIGSTLYSNSNSGSLWLMPDDGQPTTTQMILRDASAVTVAGALHVFAVTLTTEGRIRITYTINNVARVAKTANVIFANGPVTIPVHVAWTLTSGNFIRIYINGILQTLDATENGDISALTMASFVTAGQTHLGQRQTDTSTWDLGYTGKMREIIGQLGIWTPDHILNNVMLL